MVKRPALLVVLTVMISVTVLAVLTVLGSAAGSVDGA
jgi:hypothetical protein